MSEAWSVIVDQSNQTEHARDAQHNRMKRETTPVRTLLLGHITSPTHCACIMTLRSCPLGKTQHCTARHSRYTGMKTLW